MEHDLVCRRKRMKCSHNKPICGQRSSKIQFSDLPEDVLGMILSKLPPKDIVRTSVLANKWKHIWTVCPKLRFDGITMCGKDVTGTQHCSQKFVDNVNAVLKKGQPWCSDRALPLVIGRSRVQAPASTHCTLCGKGWLLTPFPQTPRSAGAYGTGYVFFFVNAVLKEHCGNVAEELDIKFAFDATLAEHLNVCVNFALSSRAKNLALDLLPAKFGLRHDRYRFPLELFDGESISRLQHLQLSFVSFQSPSHFCGFPNLKKLDLHVLRVTRKDLQGMLSNCFNLEWLSIVRCHLDDAELKVDRPLPRLLYLHIAHCEISKIEFTAMNLQTFVYRGHWIPFHLGHALALKDARLYFIGNMPLEFALTSLPILLPCVQNLIVHSSLSLKMPLIQRSNSKFSELKYLQLSFFMRTEDLNNLLYLVSFLSAAPSIENLEIHFTICALSHCSELIQRLPRCTHSYLKELSITGFAGCTGQVEFLVHIVENSPNLEVLTIDRANHFGYDEECEGRIRLKALDIARRHLDGRIPQSTKIVML